MSKQHWTDLVPIDRLIVHSQNVLSEFDRKIITTLYQPLIGSSAISLYMTLWNELYNQKMFSEEMTHYSLMVTMNLPLKDIYQERRKLEAIGLLNTFVSDEEEVRKFIYELVPPLSPERFFDDTILAVFLFRQVGSAKYIDLRNLFVSDKFDTTSYKSITSSFHEVFESIPPSEIERIEGIAEKEIFFHDKLERNIHIEDYTFEFDLFLEGLSDSIIPKKSINEKVKEAVIRLAFLYGINHIEMKNIIMGAIMPDDSIDIEVLRKQARDRYQYMNGNQLPTIIERTQPDKFQDLKQQVPTSEKEKFIKQLENMSPREWLTALSGGTEPSSADMKMIEDIMFNQKLPAGVMNVLIDYVMKKNDFQLNRNYVEKIASLWARKQLKTVAQAIDFAIEEDKRFKEVANNSAQKKQAYKKKSVTRTEMVPEWLANQTTDVEEKVNPQSDQRKQLEERLKKYKK